MYQQDETREVGQLKEAPAARPVIEQATSVIMLPRACATENAFAGPGVRPQSTHREW